MNNVNVLVGVLYLKEASDLLKNEVPDVSYSLLELSQALLQQAKLSSDAVDEANAIVNEIASEQNNEGKI